MLQTIDPEQQKFFRIHGYIAFSDLVSEKDRLALYKEVLRIQKQSPGYPPEHLNRSLPLLLDLIQTCHLAAFAYQLLKKKPLRLAYDFFFETPLSEGPPLEKEECGLILPLALEQRECLYFKHTLPKLEVYPLSDKGYLLLIFTSLHLSYELHPVVYK